MTIISLKILLIAFLVFPFAVEAERPCQTLRHLTARLAQLTGAAKDFSPRCTELPKEQFEQTIVKSSSRISDSTRLAGEEIAFQTIGLLPPSFPYADCFSTERLLTEDTFYDTASKTVFIKSGASISPANLLAESITALRDSQYNFSARTRSGTSTDLTLTSDALIQGEISFIAGRALTEQIIQASQVAVPAPTSASACQWPSALKDLLLFPIEWGAIFTARMQEKFGSAASSMAFKAPPRSSRDIIQVTNYMSKGAFSPIGGQALLTHASAMHGRRIFHDTLGQFALQALLKLHSTPALAIKASKGWRGDLLEIFHNASCEKPYTVRWIVALEELEDLNELLDAFRRYSASRYNIRISPHASNWQSLSPQGSFFSITTRASPAPQIELIFR